MTESFNDRMGATMRGIISVSVLAAVVVLGAVVWAAQGESAEPRKIDITAKKYEFSPSRKEKPVTLAFTASRARSSSSAPISAASATAG
jgi:hypothetical protein